MASCRLVSVFLVRQSDGPFVLWSGVVICAVFSMIEGYMMLDEVVV